METSIASPTEAATPSLTPEVSASQSAQCEGEVCIQDYPNLLLRPIGGEGRVTVDPSYRFGEFRKNSRYPNLGVEFLNSTGVAEPIYTLYAHLSEILVRVEDMVSAGQEIGKVGATGNIRGSVLHFEVRVGENTYSAVRNPELWLASGHDENGEALGALAGQVSDKQGNILDIRNFVLERLDSSGQAVVGRTYLRTYRGESFMRLM